MRNEEKTPELLARWRAEIPELMAALPNLNGNEKQRAVSKLYVRMREFGETPAGETLAEFRVRMWGSEEERKLARYRKELPELRVKLAAAGDCHSRAKYQALINTRETALGLASARIKPGEEPTDRQCWHYEHPEDYAPMCLEREPGDRHTPCGWKTTANWRYVTCMNCLAMRKKTEGK